MRRADRGRGRDFAYVVLDGCDWMALAMTDGAGRPYCVPIQAVREGDSLYFHCARAGKKTDCLRVNPAVCVAAVGAASVVPGAFTTAYRSAVAFGRASEIEEDGEKIRALELLCLRYTPEDMGRFHEVAARWLPGTAVWRIALESATGKEHTGEDD